MTVDMKYQYIVPHGHGMLKIISASLLQFTAVCGHTKPEKQYGVGYTLPLWIVGFIIINQSINLSIYLPQIIHIPFLHTMHRNK